MFVCGVCVQEKAMGNRPSEMMDREKAYIPELQISFMEHIAMPIYKYVWREARSGLAQLHTKLCKVTDLYFLMLLPR